MNQLNNFSPATFLTEYWQKKPVVLRNVLPDFSDFLDENDLAGLAMEEGIDSRIIRLLDNEWDVFSGPILEFESCCQGRWTLLVQGVDKYIDDASTLMEQFNFIPHWRMDDLMVSYAVAGAGVGPHTDQYDVFLIQGKGSRHWRVGQPGDYSVCQPHPKLNQIAGFEPVIDVVLESGDVLYIPPGWPHDGIAVKDCLTYSVGFRAPDQQILNNATTDTLFDASYKNQRFSDPDRIYQNDAAIVSNKDIEALKQLAVETLHSEQWQHYLLLQLSDQQCDLDLFSDAQLAVDDWQRDDMKTWLARGGCLQAIPGCRPLLSESFPHCVYINGEAIRHNNKDIKVVSRLIQSHLINQALIDDIGHDLAIYDLIIALAQRGYWIIAEDD
jgi:50S ribosomal protein L16 3-hydroxylase